MTALSHLSVLFSCQPRLSCTFGKLRQQHQYEDDDFGVGLSFDEWDSDSNATIQEQRQESAENERLLHNDIMHELKDIKDNDFSVFMSQARSEAPPLPPPPMEILNTTPNPESNAESPVHVQEASIEPPVPPSPPAAQPRPAASQLQLDAVINVKVRKSRKSKTTGCSLNRLKFQMVNSHVQFSSYFLLETAKRVNSPSTKSRR